MELAQNARRHGGGLLAKEFHQLVFIMTSIEQAKLELIIPI